MMTDKEELAVKGVGFGQEAQHLYSRTCNLPVWIRTDAVRRGQTGPAVTAILPPMRVIHRRMCSV